MEVTSIQKFIHTSPRKLRLVADMVRKQNPNRAMEVLRFTPQAAAKELSGAINTALSNAKQGGLNLELIGFKSIEVNEGPKMKRFRSGARGRVKPYKRKMSHIKIVITDEMVVSKKSVIASKVPMKSRTLDEVGAKQSGQELKPAEIATSPDVHRDPRNDETKENKKKTVKKVAKKETK